MARLAAALYFALTLKNTQHYHLKRLGIDLAMRAEGPEGSGCNEDR